jgi:excisionase family DNA binding protein
MRQLMTFEEAADYLRLSHSTLYRLVQKGKVPASKVGGAWRFKRQILDNWLASQYQQGGGAVLVVEDDPKVRDILADIIVGQGYQAVAIGSGETALEEIERQHFDLVFLDLVLPGLSGPEVLERLKAKDRKIVVAIVTGYADCPIATEAMSMGPVLLIRKPFRVDDVMQVLNLVMKARI